MPRIFDLIWTHFIVNLFEVDSDQIYSSLETWNVYGIKTQFKGAVSRQSSSFCLILPITRPQSLWNIKYAKKLQVNDKIRDPRQTNVSPEHYF